MESDKRILKKKLEAEEDFVRESSQIVLDLLSMKKASQIKGCSIDVNRINYYNKCFYNALDVACKKGLTCRDIVFYEQVKTVLATLDLFQGDLNQIVENYKFSQH
ncbi:MAG: hypothetical protein ACI4UX_03370 [Clostridia bacterium]